MAKFLLVEGGALPGNLVRWLMGDRDPEATALDCDVICELAWHVWEEDSEVKEMIRCLISVMAESNAPYSCHQRLPGT